MNWQPGDIAIYLYAPPNSSGMDGYVGTEVTVLSTLQPATPTKSSKVPRGTPVYRIDIPITEAGWAKGTRHIIALPSQLGPLPPGDEVTSWEDCVWQPKTLVPVLHD